MPKFSANLTFLFNDLPVMDRLPAARSLGFRYVEYAFPYDLDIDELKACLDHSDLKLVLVNLSA